MAELAGAARELQHAVDRFMRDNGLPSVSAGVVVGRTLAWHVSQGVTDDLSGTPVDAHTPYRVASITKTFTATAIVQLRDRGALALDDPLVEHLPEFAAVGQPFGAIELVTLRHLLQHTSGLQGDVPNRDPREWTCLSTADTLASLPEVAVVIRPQTAFKYSNLGYRLLGEVVARAGRCSYFDYLQSRLLEPLELRGSGPAPVDRAAAVGHYRVPYSDRVRPAPAIDPALTGGEGGLWCSLHDLARWLTFHLASTDEPAREASVVSRDSRRELQRPTFLADDTWSAAQGLGWAISRVADRTLVGHTGFVGGFESDCVFSPQERLGVVVLCNGVCVRRPRELSLELLEHARRVVEPEPAGSLVDESTRAVAELLGPYVSDAGTELVISGGAGSLLCSAPRAPGAVELVATEDPLVFRVREGRAQGELARFWRSPAGRVEGVNLAGYPFRRDPQ